MYAVEQRELSFSAAPPASAAPGTAGVRLGLALDHDAWLEWLADEWWPLMPPTALRLGVGAPRGETETGSRIRVVAWIDPAKLPATKVWSWRETCWTHVALSDLGDLDKEIAWNGPLPLFAVTSFSVGSESEAARLRAMAEGFSNLARSEQSIEVEQMERSRAVADAPPDTPDVQTHAPPRQWNALRGAAAMAVYSVPAITPWVEVLCASLAVHDDGSLADNIGAPWLHEPPWRRSQAVPGSTTVNSQVALWRATVEVLLDVRPREVWRPLRILEAIRDCAISHHGMSEPWLDEFVTETRAILNDEQTVSLARCSHHPVRLALQLFLLRPLPDRFVTWAHQLRALPPVVWWTGAILSGLVGGYRDLDQRFRGSIEGRRRLAVRTWRLSLSSDENVLSWPGITEATPTSQRETGRVQLLWDGVPWGERVENGRGRWFSAALDVPKIREAAIDLAKALHPACLRRRCRLVDSTVPISGPGNAQVVENEPRQLYAEGEVLLDLPYDAPFVTILDDNAFRHWLVRGGIGEPLPDLPAPRQAFVPTGVERPGPEPPGLIVIDNFVSEAEERDLLATIDAAQWSDDLTRRVQHYGWAYDYKARRVDRHAYLGPLPEWAVCLGRRLFEQKLVEELPDQVIVNEYVGDQGIARHVDCIPCFRGAIVSVSLEESWDMIFWPPVGKNKVTRTLLRRSAVVLTGEVREKWQHEIPRRKKEPRGPRGRRVSITFRKVNVPWDPDGASPG